MQSTQRRCLVLIVVLALGCMLQVSFVHPRHASPARWPTDDALYHVSDWAVGPTELSPVVGGPMILRTYSRPSGELALLAMTPRTEAKAVYGAGADVPFLGSGYTVSPAPRDWVPSATGSGALLVQHDGVWSLLLHARGERRGLLGSGLLGWSMALTDAVLGQPNDYYLLRILVPLDRLDSPLALEAAKLAETLFPRLAAWYAA